MAVSDNANRASLGAEFLYVNPQNVNLCTLGVNSANRPRDVRLALQRGGAVMSGGWDTGVWKTGVRNITDLDVYNALHDCLLLGKPWEETAFFHRVTRMIEEGTPKWGCQSREELLNRLETEVRGLYESIKQHGYMTQAELGSAKLDDEIRVGIRRDGRFMMFDGRHRLIISRLLGLNSVPVRVIVRHQEWVDLKESIVDYINTRLRGRVYQKIDHPDLASLPAKHGTERISLVRRGLSDVSSAGKRALDVGTHWGYMAQQLSKLGFDVTGIERDSDSARFARTLATATESDYKIWEGDLLDFPGGRYDVVLALSIFHHMIKTEARHERLKVLLGRLDTDLLLFEPHDPNLSAEQMRGAYRDYSPAEFVAFVSRYIGLRQIDYLGTPDDRYRRPMFKLSR